MVRKDESSESLPEIGSVDADGNRERASVFKAVIKAMECIPYSPERSEERSDEIRQAASVICWVAMWADLHDQPNLKLNRGGTAKDLEELQGIHDLSFELAHRLNHLHRGSRGALEKQDPSGLLKFQKEVGRWSDRAHEAWSELNENESEHRAYRSGRSSRVR